MAHSYNQSYTGEHLTKSGFPLGGIGAGMICLEGSGKLTQVSIRHRPELFHEPLLFSAIHVQGMPNGTRILEGPPPDWKLTTRWNGENNFTQSSGNGLYNKTYGLPLFESTTFTPRFPFATVDFQHEQLPLQCQLTAYSPFIPTDADNSSLPVASLQYTFKNTSNKTVKAVYSFHSHTQVITGSSAQCKDAPKPHVLTEDRGFVIVQPETHDNPAGHCEFAAWCDAPHTRVDCAWFRGGWFDAVTMLMKKITSGDTTSGTPYTQGEPSSGGSLYVPLCIEPGESQSVQILLSWYVPVSSHRVGHPAEEKCECDHGDCCTPLPETYCPWYASRFGSGGLLRAYWREEHDTLKSKSALFSSTFFASTLPPEILEAVAANLCILKSPTVLRQADGRLWAWEGCHDDAGCCHGSCTHVWNYAQAICHLFPDLERSLRLTEFTASQNEQGKQNFRSTLPIGKPKFDHHAAADGQLGGLMKLYREWRTSGDTAWLKGLWPNAKASMDYCIDTWDPDETGLLVEPHHNTYDIEFWGPDGMCSSFYLGALQAASLMADALSEPHDRYDQLMERGSKAINDQLFNGEYFHQQVRWKDLRAKPPHLEDKSLIASRYTTPESITLLEAEGPKYQYGTGCLADGILGDWIARVCGLPPVLAGEKARSHLLSVFTHNFKSSLVDHINPQRCGYACGKEAGLLLCTWPRGGALSLPFPYSEEVWTGFEYQVASHLMMFGHVEDGLTIVRAARGRYDGIKRSPFNEIECGHWYARAMSSYGLIQGITGIRYDAIDKTLTVRPSIRGDFKSFLSTATGFGLICVTNNQVHVEVAYGEIDVQHIDFVPCVSNEK